MSKTFVIYKKKTIIGNSRSNSMKSNKRKFKPNIKNKKFWISDLKKYIKLKLSTKDIRTIKKNGINFILKNIKLIIYNFYLK